MSDAATGPSVPAGHEDPTRPATEQPGRVVVVTHNHIAEAIVALAEIVGRPTVVLDHRDGGTDPEAWLRDHPLEAEDALVLCDHDAPAAQEMLRSTLEGRAGYVAMMGSRRRAEGVFAMLVDEARPAEQLDRLHVPAGLNLGGRSAGEIALSVVSEIVATAHGRPGGPMKQ